MQVSPKPIGAGTALAGGFLVQAALLAPLLAAGRIGVLAMTAALAIYSMIALLVRQRFGHGDFGLANTVTAGRAGMIAVLPALILAPGGLDAAIAWAVIGCGLAALVLDGLDGQIARRRGEASAFGARFDMEIDAGFVLFLSGLVWSSGRTGAWILLAGLLRYFWVGAGALWPLLRHKLPPSLLRKSVCVLVLLLLLLALAPIIPPAWAPLPCALGLVLLLASFGRDLVWLIRGAGMAAAKPPHIQAGAAVYDGNPRVESE